uniref:27 kDa hemolymph glycoprotein n=1 Tax=Culex pipiens TaxID=7175 RepID=A0A8D8BSK7_CULPI
MPRSSPKLPKRLEWSFSRGEFGHRFKQCCKCEFGFRYCPQVKNSMRCITQVTDMVRKCVEPERIALYDTFVSTIPQAVDLICKNDGELIFVDGPNFKECSKKLPRYLDDCSSNIASFADTMDLAAYGEYQCTELDKVRQCYKKELADCRVPRMIELFDLFYRPVVKASPCKDFIKLEELKEVKNNNI